MNRLLERLDRNLTVLVPLTYLVGLLLGTAAYFSGVVVRAELAVGIALAFSVEVHSWLTQRRVRLLWQQLAKLGDDVRRARLLTHLRLQVAVLTFLVALSIFNGIAFWALLSHPTTAGDWLPIVVRGSIIPLLFLATGALAPISSDAAALLSQAADDMLYATVRTSVRQWKRRIRRARKAGVDLAPLAVSLMLDAGESDGARRIQLIAEGLAAAEAGAEAGAGSPFGRPTPTPPPTGGGTPIPFARRGADGDLHIIPPIGAGWPDALLPAEPNVQNAPATVPAPVSQPFGVAAAASRPLSPEEARARQVLEGDPALSLDKLMAQADVSRSTASKVKRIVNAERERAQQLAQ